MKRENWGKIVVVILVLTLFVSCFNKNDVFASEMLDKVSIKCIDEYASGFDIHWKKYESKCDGFELQMAEDQSFVKGLWSHIVEKADATKSGARNLKKEQKYYIRIRVFLVNNKEKLYGPWSDVKSFTTTVSAVKSKVKDNTSTKNNTSSKKKSSKKVIKLNKSYTFMKVGENKTLKLLNAKKKKVKWSLELSQNSKGVVATINKKGEIKAKNYGNCTVVAKYNNKKYKCKLYIIRCNPKTYNNLKYYPYLPKLNVTRTINLEGVYKTEIGKVKWKNSNSKVVSMNIIKDDKKPCVEFKIIGVGKSVISAIFKGKTFKTTIVVSKKDENGKDGNVTVVPSVG